ncbi:MAG: hypothetical protein L0216_13770 [Planctomycetales bacterium]|nr:hypothetical protein [Planctomycetales bacterium]
MTTAFAHAVRGQFVSAVAAQPFGAVLAVATALWLPISLAFAATGRSFTPWAARVRWDRVGWAALALALGSWGYKALRVQFG